MYLTLIPSILFWALLYFGREELGLKGIAISILVWLGLRWGLTLLGLSLIFTAAESLLDIVLFIIIFGGNMNITLR